jgi:hypothetical protein
MRKPRTFKPAVITLVVLEAAATDRAAALAHFLLANGAGSVCGWWHGRLNAAEQRALFGRYIGRGVFTIDGERELVRMSVSVCFGHDHDVRFQSTWAAL